MSKSKNMSIWKNKVIAIAAVLALAACSSNPPVPPNNFYRLDPKPEGGAMATPVLDGTIEVSRFVADGSASNRPLLYSSPSSPNAVSEYNYDFWSEAPPVLIKSALVSYLRASGVAQRVVTPEMRVTADYEVFGRIKSIEVITGSPYKGKVSVEMGLRHGKDNHLLMLDDFEAEVSANGSNIGAGVAAIDRALAEIFGRFVAEIKSHK